MRGSYSEPQLHRFFKPVERQAQHSVVLPQGNPSKKATCIHPCAICTVLQEPAPLDLALLSVITCNPSLNPKVFYSYQQLAVIQRAMFCCRFPELPS